MSSPDTKVAKAYNVLYTDYAMLVGFEPIGFYYHLMWLHSRSLGKPVTFEYIKSKTFIPEARLQVLIRKLLIFKLIKKERIENSGGEKDWEFKTVAPKYISKEDKSSMVADLYAKVLIDENEKLSLIDYINDTAKDVHNDEGEDASFLVKDKDFSEPAKGVGEDTPMGLVFYYYKKLGQIFGGRYISRNEGMEAAHLSECMKKNGDTAQVTREFFDWILERAKKTSMFDKVSGMGLYPEFRKHAYHSLYVKNTGDKKFESEVGVEETLSEEEKIIKNIKGVFDIYKNKGEMTDDEIVDKVLKKNFSDEAIKMFMEKE